MACGCLVLALPCPPITLMQAASDLLLLFLDQPVLEKCIKLKHSLRILEINSNIPIPGYLNPV